MSTIDPSTIDPTKPTQGEALTADVRANELATQQQLQNAKNDIEALEGQSGGHVIENNGTPLADRTALNFSTGLTASDNAGADSTDVVLDTGTTDALYAPLGHVGATGAAHGLATGVVNGFMSAGDFSKLAGIPANAAPGDMLKSVYDTDDSGIVDNASNIATRAVNNTGATILKGSFVNGSPGTPPSITLADGPSQLWAEAVAGEDIANGQTGIVIIGGGLEGVNTVGAAVGDPIYLGASGAWTLTQPLTVPWQEIGRIFNVDAVAGSITVDLNSPVTPEAEGSTGVLVLTEASGTLPHSNASLTTWTEIVPGAGESSVVQLLNMTAGANPGRLAFDYSGTTGPQPDAGSIAGTVTVHASVEFAGADDFLEVAPAKNGAIIFAELAGYAGIGGNQTAGTAIPVTMSFPIGGWSDGDELSIVTRGSVATFIIHSLSVSFMSADGAGGGGGGGAIPDHNTLPGRGATDAHPQTAITGLTAALDARALQTSLDAHITDPTAAHAASAVGVTPVGSLAATDAQAAFAELDSDLSGHVTDAVGAHAASAVSVTPAGGISSNNAQAALQELDTDLTGHIGSGGAAHADATGVASGFMSAAQVTKLAGIEDNANAYSHPNHFGDVVSAGDGDTTIQPGVVSNTKLADMPGYSLKLRTSATPGAPENITIASLPENASGIGQLLATDQFGNAFNRVDIATLGGGGGATTFEELTDTPAPGSYVGAAGQTVVVNGTEDGLTFTPGGGGSSPLTTKGDLFGFGTADDRLPVGTADGQVLKVFSAGPLGLQYQHILGASAIGGTVVTSQSNGSIQDSGIAQTDLARLSLAADFQLTLDEQGIGTVYQAAAAAETTSWTPTLSPGNSPRRYTNDATPLTVNLPTGDGDAVLDLGPLAALSINGGYTVMGSRAAGKSQVCYVARDATNTRSIFVYGSASP